MNNKPQQSNLFDLTLRLSHALDQNYDVVNMEAVVSVISALEGTTITKEQLEATRLAKYINQLRRRTKCDTLARRAKSLLKTWREMVCIQPQAQVISDSPVASTTIMNVNENAHLQQQNICSTSMSPKCFKNNDGTAAENYHSNALIRCGPPSTVSSSLTKSANSNVYNNCNKRLEILPEGPSGSCGPPAASSSSVPMAFDTTGKQQPPLTSFTNLIKGFHNNSNRGIGSKSNADVNYIPSMSTTSTFAGQHSREKTASSFVIDQSSNSNTEISLPSSLKHKSVKTTKDMFLSAPIVIDIQDSNSGSNLIDPIASSTAAKSSETTISTVPPSNVSLLTATSSTKTKKAKKEKKRKEATQNEAPLPPYHSDVPSVVVFAEDGSLSYQQLRRPDNGRAKFPKVIENNTSQRSYSGPHISDILALSNSSMSSMFPGEASLSLAMDVPNRAIDINNQQSTNLSISDFTFTGKFNQSNNSNDTFIQPDDIVYNGTDRSSMISPSSSSIKISSSNKFIPFRDRGCNSNDSTSNSQTSQFDAVDMASPDNNIQSNLMQDIRTRSFVPQSLAFEDSHRQPIAAVPAMTVPHQQTGDNDITSNTPALSEKIPKKRGRKKGSKGVDSVIAKETSLSSQMLMSSLGSGGKKVKTTKELFVEMQNRKKGSFGTAVAPSSPILSNWASQHLQLNSQPESSCSEPSLHSPRTLDACSNNATVSTVATRSTPDKCLANSHADEVGSESDTVTSEPSRDSFAVRKRINDKVGISMDSNSNTQLLALPSAMKSEQLRSNATLTTIATIENQLRELLKLLPAVPLVKDIESECTSELIPCSCKIIETLPVEPSKCETEEQLDDTSSSPKHKEALHVNNVDFEAKNDVKIANVNLVKDELILCSKNQNIMETTKRQKPQKSIFDLDFDDEEDPLHTLKAEAAAAAINQELPGLEETNDTKPILVTKTEADDFQNTQLPIVDRVETTSTSQQMLPLNNFPTYTVEEDPLCPAKQRFEIQTQIITEFHIKALHNCYISNVNGNWDNSDTKISETGNKATDILAASSNSTDDGHNVVPMYGTLITERINKDLTNFAFTKNFKSKAGTATSRKQKIYNTPFLGVATQFSNHIKTQRDGENVKCPLENTNEMKEIAKLPSNESVQNVDIATESPSAPRDVKLNNNIPLRDITELLLYTDNAYDTETTKASGKSDNNSNNLLTVVDNLNILSYGDDLNQQKIGDETDADKVETLSIASGNEDESVIIENTVDLIDALKTANKMQLNEHGLNVETNNLSSSRRSSSCSNSSLKQTQQSINMRLRQQRLLDKQQLEKSVNDDIKSKRRKHGRNRKISHNKEIDSESDDAENTSEVRKKPRLIKRIKLGIHGPRQVSLRSSDNSSSGDEMRTSSKALDYVDDMSNEDDNMLNTFNCIRSEDDDMYRSTNDDGTENRDGDVDDVDELDADDDEEYADFDDEDEDEYAGDYHEVVTRDISIPSTGNNHIVLTIKKTPSKLNSPSNSLSAISPSAATIDAANKTANNCASNNDTNHTTASSEAINVLSNVDYAECDITNDKEQPVTTALVDTLENDLSNTNENLNPAATTIAKNDHNHQTETNSVANFEKIDEKPHPLTDVKRPKRKVSHKNRKNKVLKKSTFPFDSTNNENTTSSESLSNRKLHKRLFFPYEICFRSDDGSVKDNIFNFNSCSSSCTSDDDDDWEDDSCNDGELRLQDKLKNLAVDSPSNQSVIENHLDSQEGHAELDTQEHAPLEEVQAAKRENTDSQLCYEDNTTTNDKSSEYTSCGEGDEVDLPKENNGLLLSFNNIYYTPCNQSDTLSIGDDSGDGTEQKIQKQRVLVNNDDKQLTQQLRNEKCDDYNNMYNNNNNNLNVTNYDNEHSLAYDSCRNSCSKQPQLHYHHNNNVDLTTNFDSIGETQKQSTENNINPNMKAAAQTTSEQQQPMMVPYKEYRSGLRAVDEDVDDDDGNNCARIQQFKEWHQVLQLRSYNDELLTVLPYVVLD